jgi:hypothetical protein
VAVAEEELLLKAAKLVVAGVVLGVLTLRLV